MEDLSEAPLPEREQLAKEYCEGDPDLYSEIKELLRNMKDDGFLVPGYVAESQASDATLAPSTSIGGFRILRKIGEGGMGVVYEAEQAQPKRRVALKLLRRFHSEESLRRFQFEAEVLGRLQHPGIAKIHAAGIDVGIEGPHDRQPWMAMELLEDSKTMVEYCRVSGGTVQEILSLQLSVLSAISHAHQHGVIHRDLKPANILVDAGGQSKVIDFGIARATSPAQDAQFTRAGEIYGTIPYMSPEQLRGNSADVDTRTDVYSLGVLLYELLAGRPAFDISAIPTTEAIQAICAGALPHPSVYNRRIPRDLDLIVAKAVHPDADQRYATAADFARDLKHFLNHEPVEARRPGLLYVASRFASRNRGAVIATFLVFTAIVGGSITSLVYARESGIAQRRSDMLFATLLDGSTKSTFEHSNKVFRLAGGSGVAAGMLESTLKDLDTMKNLAPGHPGVEVQWILTKIRLGDLLGNPAFSNLGKRQAAIDAYNEAVDTARLAHSLDAGHPSIRNALAIALRRQGTMLVYEKEMKRAGEILDESLRILEKLVHEDESDPARRSEVGLAHNALAEFHGRTGAFDKLHAEVAIYHETFQSVVREHPENRDARTQLAFSFQRLGASCWMRKDYALAAQHYETASKHLNDLIAGDPTSNLLRREAASATMWHGSALLQSNRAAEAEVALLSAATDLERLAESDPGDRSLHALVINSLFMTGNAVRTQGKAPDERRRAAPFYERARAYIAKLEAAGPLGAELSSYKKTLSNALVELGAAQR